MVGGKKGWKSAKKTVTTITRRAGKGYASKRGYKTYRFATLARSICPNHLTVRQYVNAYNTSTGLSGFGTAGNTSIIVGQNTLTPQFFSIGFQLNDVPQFATYQALFDRYKIIKVKLTFKPILNSADLVGATGNRTTPQTFLTTVDHDDAVLPTSMDVVRDYQTCKDRNFFKPFSIELTPKIALAAYSGVFTSFANTESYIDIASPAVQHYGIKGAISQGPTGGLQSWTVVGEYIIDFKNIR